MMSSPLPDARRIRVGDWLIPYDDATQEVVLKRTMKDVLAAKPGNHLDCMNSRCIKAARTKGVFPHPVYVVSTIMTRVYIVDQVDSEGEPVHCIRYEISKHDSRLIGEHDTYGAGEPGELRLMTPADPKGSPRRKENGRGPDGYDSGSEERLKPGQVWTGKQSRPITSVGAARRFKVAVGAMSVDQEIENGANA
jgi:hypothetical protein